MKKLIRYPFPKILTRLQRMRVVLKILLKVMKTAIMRRRLHFQNLKLLRESILRRR
jgi:hypothetical protein